MYYISFLLLVGSTRETDFQVLLEGDQRRRQLYFSGGGGGVVGLWGDSRLWGPVRKMIFYLQKVEQSLIEVIWMVCIRCQVWQTDMAEEYG